MNSFKNFRQGIAPVVLPLLLLLADGEAMAQVPHLINYQARLTDNSGKPANGSFAVVFEIYDAASGGSQLWTETHTVTAANNGIFNVMLGSVNAIPAGLFDSEAGRYLQVTVNGSVLTPRRQFGSVPDAFSTGSTGGGSGDITIAKDGADVNGIMSLTLPFSGTTSSSPAFSITCTSTASSATAIIGRISSTSPSFARGVTGLILAPSSGQSAPYSSGVEGGNYGTQSNSYGVYGWHSGNGRGVYGHSYGSTTGIGVFGSTTGWSGNASGIYGHATGSNANGVSGYATGTYGTGVSGNALGSSGRGVYGYAPSSGYAGWFSGRVHVNGTLSKAAGLFKIDHPLDPANKYLCHSFVESPDMKNIYDGVVVLNANGEAWVELPNWFQVLNRDFRYLLTAIGGPAPKLFIAQEIANNRFKIAGGAPNLKVSWQVTGIRQDAFANKYRIPVEENKSVVERGHYLHPEAFGQPQELSVDRALRPGLEENRIEPDPKRRDSEINRIQNMENDHERL